MATPRASRVTGVLVGILVLVGNAVDSRCGPLRAKPQVEILCEQGSPFKDEVLLPWMEYYGIPGLSIAVVEKDAIQWAKGYGVLDRRRSGAVTTRTAFQAASLSKPLAAATALLLLRQRGVGLDEDVRRHLRGWRIPENAFTARTPVTPRLLLSHSAGFNIHGFEGYGGTSALPSLVQILDGSGPANNAAIRVTSEPGLSFAYSGGGYQVLQQLLEDLSGGRRYEDLARTLVLEPVGMTESSYSHPLRSEAAASGHDSGGTTIPGRWHEYPEIAAAALWATPSDLARFLVALQRSRRGESGALLPQDLAQHMFTAQRPAGIGRSVGLGVFLTGAHRMYNFNHTGANAGYQSSLVGYLNVPSGVVVMTNSDNGHCLFEPIVAAIRVASETSRSAAARGKKAPRLPVP